MSLSNLRRQMSKQAVELAVPAEKVKCCFEPDTSSWCRLSNGRGGRRDAASKIIGKTSCWGQKQCRCRCVQCSWFCKLLLSCHVIVRRALLSSRRRQPPQTMRAQRILSLGSQPGLRSRPLSREIHPSQRSGLPKQLPTPFVPTTMKLSQLEDG